MTGSSDTVQMFTSKTILTVVYVTVCSLFLAGCGGGASGVSEVPVYRMDSAMTTITLSSENPATTLKQLYGATVSATYDVHGLPSALTI